MTNKQMKLSDRFWNNHIDCFTAVKIKLYGEIKHLEGQRYLAKKKLKGQEKTLAQWVIGKELKRIARENNL